MLPLLAMLLFALLGIGALIVDGGLALAEQARLETTAEMVASEWGYVQATPGDWPPACESSTEPAARRRCLENEFVAPLLGPLGVEREALGATGQAWRRSDAALDGVAIDSRGVRLGELDAPDVDLVDDVSNVRLSRSSPLIFGWAAIAPQTTGGVVPDFEALQAVRNDQGFSPDDSGGGGIYGEGFSLAANAAVDLRGALALWAGPPIESPTADATATEDDDYLTGGVVPIAWRLDQLEALRAALGSGVDATLPLSLDEDDERTLTDGEGDLVACRFDPAPDGLSVGETLAVPSVSASLAPDRWPTAYLPVVETLDCDLVDAQVLGFLEVAVESRPGGVVVVGQSAGLRRNAAAWVPESAEFDMAAVLAVETRLGEPLRSVWTEAALEYALRVPSPASLGAGSGFARVDPQ